MNAFFSPLDKNNKKSTVHNEILAPPPDKESDQTAEKMKSTIQTWDVGLLSLTYTAKIIGSEKD